MGNSKYKFTPNDVAVMLILSNFSHKRENEIIEDIFYNYNSELTAKYRKDYDHSRKTVRERISFFELDYDEFSVTQLILQEFGTVISDINIDDVFGRYFRLIKLQIMYSQSGYKRLKLRSILKDFGYKRRSATLNSSIQNALKALGLCTYLRGMEPCDITEINIDQMVIIRLK